MTLSVYCIYDSVAEQNSHPFCSPNDLAALRELDRVSRRELSTDPSEYHLYRLGHWDPIERVLVALRESERVLKPLVRAQH